MSDQNKPGQPKDKEQSDRSANQNQPHKNPQDRQNQSGPNKSHQDSSKKTNPSHTKE